MSGNHEGLALRGDPPLDPSTLLPPQRIYDVVSGPSWGWIHAPPKADFQLCVPSARVRAREWWGEGGMKGGRGTGMVGGRVVSGNNEVLALWAHPPLDPSIRQRRTFSSLPPQRILHRRMFHLRHGERSLQGMDSRSAKGGLSALRTFGPCRGTGMVGGGWDEGWSGGGGIGYKLNAEIGLWSVE